MKLYLDPQRSWNRELGAVLIIEETDDWLVVNKPAGLLMHPTNPKPVPTLWDELKGILAYELINGGQISFINRLDRETSGIVLVAKNKETARALNLAMQAGELNKGYLAIVFGWPEWEETVVDAPLARKGESADSAIYLKQWIHPDGAASRTFFRRIARFVHSTSNGHRFAVVEAFPETGRMHQIRVHLASLGHPLVGDKIYGPNEQCYLQFIETGWSEAMEQQLLLPRHALHASSLNWGDHRWLAPIPPDFLAFIEK